jgi:two-component system KDP operon response regulator KdpE
VPANRTEIGACKFSWPQTALVGRAALLVIDGDAGHCRYIGRILRVAGWTVSSLADPTEARTALIEQRFDVVLLSLGPGQENWMAEIRALVPAGSVPVLVLLKDDRPGAVARMLDRGADECLAAPFDASDLSARSIRMLRLVWHRHGMAPLARRSELQLDLARPFVRANGRDIQLTKLEYRMLWVLAQANGGVSSFQDIESRVWVDSGKPHRRELRRVMHNLRGKLGKDRSGQMLLRAEPRVGYRLYLPVGST